MTSRPREWRDEEFGEHGSRSTRSEGKTFEVGNHLYSSFWKSFQVCCEEGVVLGTCVEMMGVDLRRTKQLKAVRTKCEVRFSSSRAKIRHDLQWVDLICLSHQKNCWISWGGGGRLVGWGLHHTSLHAPCADM